MNLLRHNVIVLALVAVSLAVAACGSEKPEAKSGSGVGLVRAEMDRIESPGSTTGQIAKLVRGNNAFAFDIYHTETGDGNLIYSPCSISLAFSMAYAGAQGETEEQRWQRSLTTCRQRRRILPSTPSSNSCQGLVG